MSGGPWNNQKEQDDFAAAVQAALRKLPRNVVAIVVVADADDPSRSSILVNPGINVRALLELALHNFTGERPASIESYPCTDPNCPSCKAGLH